MSTRISDRESDYHKRRLQRGVKDVDSLGNQLSYKEIMEAQEVDREKARLEDVARRMARQGTAAGIRWRRP